MAETKVPAVRNRFAAAYDEVQQKLDRMLPLIERAAHEIEGGHASFSITVTIKNQKDETVATVKGKASVPDGEAEFKGQWQSGQLSLL